MKRYLNHFDLVRTSIGAFLFSLILALSWSRTAAAHLDLRKSFPENGDIIETSPEFVQLWFNEELDTFESQIFVSDSEGNQVDLEDSKVNPEDL